MDGKIPVQAIRVSDSRRESSALGSELVLVQIPALP